MTAKQSSTSTLDATTFEQARENELSWQLDAAHDELRILYAALDNVQSGLLLLGADLRARYSNAALHGLFKNAPPDFIRSAKPRYEDLLRGTQNVVATSIEDYVRQRLEWVKSGTTEPMDIKLSDGGVVRCHVSVLPDGGRMLVYSDISDIVHASEELARLATMDGMTGIYNRRHFLALADREWLRARRYHLPLSLLMIDADNFKGINDTYGHHAGDAVIIHLAKIAASCKRDSDVLARVGGEEFAILLPETGLHAAAVVGERLRWEVSQTRPPVAENVLTTISVGIAAATPEIGDFAGLMRAADEALYEAKQGGRNRIAWPQSQPGYKEDLTG